MKIDATTLMRSSFIRSRVNFVQVTSYTKNQAVKNNPIAIKTNVKWANIAGFTGLAYLAMFSIPIYETEKQDIHWFQYLSDSVQLTMLIPMSEQFLSNLQKS